MYKEEKASPHKMLLITTAETIILYPVASSKHNLAVHTSKSSHALCGGGIGEMTRGREFQPRNRVTHGTQGPLVRYVLKWPYWLLKPES